VSRIVGSCGAKAIACCLIQVLQRCLEVAFVEFHHRRVLQRKRIAWIPFQQPQHELSAVGGRTEVAEELLVLAAGEFVVGVEVAAVTEIETLDQVLVKLKTPPIRLHLPVEHDLGDQWMPRGVVDVCFAQRRLDHDHLGCRIEHPPPDVFEGDVEGAMEESCPRQDAEAVQRRHQEIRPLTDGTRDPVVFVLDDRVEVLAFGGFAQGDQELLVGASLEGRDLGVFARAR
jgi:hypothetical protein